MTNRHLFRASASKSETATDLRRPVPILPVAKPRGKLQKNGGDIDEIVTYQNTQPSDKHRPVPPPRDTDTMTKTKAILNEAADAVAKSFAKQTQGINKGKRS